MDTVACYSLMIGGWLLLNGVSTSTGTNLRELETKLTEPQRFRLGNGQQFDANIPQIINSFPPGLARLLAALTGERGPVSVNLQGPSMSETVMPADTSRRKRQVDSGNPMMNCATVPPTCPELPFDSMMPHDGSVFAFKGDQMWILTKEGEMTSHEPMPTKQLFPGATGNVTAALRMNSISYLFFGATYMKFRPIRRPTLFPAPVAVASGFHGVPVPVNGAFRLNAHTYVFFSGNKFVFYQPDANPPVNPKYSPNFLRNIRGGPSNIDYAFNMDDGRRFLVSGEIMYELDAQMKVIGKQPLIRHHNGTGWLNCSTHAVTTCTGQEMNPHKTTFQPSTTISTTVATSTAASTPNLFSEIAEPIDTITDLVSNSTDLVVQDLNSTVATPPEEIETEATTHLIVGEPVVEITPGPVALPFNNQGELQAQQLFPGMGIVHGVAEPELLPEVAATANGTDAVLQDDEVATGNRTWVPFVPVSPSNRTEGRDTIDQSFFPINAETGTKMSLQNQVNRDENVAGVVMNTTRPIQNFQSSADSDTKGQNARMKFDMNFLDQLELHRVVLVDLIDKLGNLTAIISQQTAQRNTGVQ